MLCMLELFRLIILWLRIIPSHNFTMNNPNLQLNYNYNYMRSRFIISVLSNFDVYQTIHSLIGATVGD